MSSPSHHSDWPRREISEEAYRFLFYEVFSATVDDFFKTCVRHAARTLNVRYAFIAECGGGERASTLAFWNGEVVADNFEYDLAGTPCVNVLRGEACHYESNLQQKFPFDKGLADWRAESYLGVPVVDGAGNAIGHLAVVDDKPMPPNARALEMLTIFAARAASEMARRQAEIRLRTANEELRKLETLQRTVLAVNNAIMTDLTREGLFQSISGALRPIMPFDRIAVFVYDPEKQTLRLTLAQTAVAPHSRFIPGVWELPISKTPAGWVALNQKPLVRRDLVTEKEYELEDLMIEQGIRSLAIVPLIIRGRCIGTMNLAGTRAGQFSSVNLDVLQEIANQVALAVENLRAYEEIASLKAKIEAENVYLKEEIQTQHNFQEIVGNSSAILEVLQSVDSVARTDSTVLILGETGTGKELIARAIHDRSARRMRPMVKVNCGAIPAGLVESELFGHMKGAFTGALDKRIGRFELADGGTIFLDEVGELPMDTQVKLLRVLQEHEFEPLGSSRTVKVNVRVIAATNRNLEAEIKQGRFRADLYYRLNVLQTYLPPLRQRRSDIPLLVSFFVDRLSRQFGREITGVSQESMEALTHYDWPGNIRELQNVVERAVVLSPGPVLKLSRDLLPVTHSAASAGSGAANSSAENPPSASNEYQTLEDVEKAHIAQVLKSCDWVIEGNRGAANILGLHPNTLRSRLKKLGIERPTN